MHDSNDTNNCPKWLQVCFCFVLQETGSSTFYRPDIEHFIYTRTRWQDCDTYVLVPYSAILYIQIGRILLVNTIKASPCIACVPRPTHPLVDKGPGDVYCSRIVEGGRPVPYKVTSVQLFTWVVAFANHRIGHFPIFGIWMSGAYKARNRPYVYV